MSDVTIEAREHEDVAALRSLGRALALGEGFAFHLVTVTSRGDADNTIAAAEEGGRALRRTVDRIRIDPYENLGIDGPPLEAQALIQNVLQVLETPDGGRESRSVVWLDLSRAPAPTQLGVAQAGTDDAPIRALFRRMNERRNHILNVLSKPLVLLAPARLVQAFAEEAPDFWSIRTLSIRLASPDRQVSAERLSWGVSEPESAGVVDETEQARMTEEIRGARQRIVAAPDDLSHRVALLHMLIRHALLQRQAGATAASVELNREAVALAGELAKKDPQFERDLAMSLNNLGNALRAAGDTGGALIATREAADIYTFLANKDPATFLPQLVMTLNNLGNRLSAAGEHEAALAVTRRAVRDARTLASDRADAFVPLLAASLENLGLRLNETANYEEALAASSEAVAMYRQLAEAQPAAFESELAASLNNLGVRLAAVQNHEAALATTREAAGMYRRLTDQQPLVFMHYLAGALHNLGRRFSALGDHTNALLASREATILRGRLAGQNPKRFREDLRQSTTSLRSQLPAAGVDPDRDAQLAHAEQLLAEAKLLGV